MIKKILWSLSMMSISLLTSAQETEKTTDENASNWTKGGIFTLNFSQVAMDNWAAGGQNAVSGTSFFEGFANYKKGSASWDNTLSLGYGLQKQDGEDWFKNNDKLEFASKYGHQASKKWYYTGLLDFKSQFAKGYDNVTDADHISNFFAPAFMNLAVGMDYKPNDNFTIFISPITGKMTFVTDSELSDKGAFGVDAGDKFRAEFGAFVKVAYKVELMENINFSTKLDLFSSYSHNPQNIDVNWDNLLTFKVNKYFNASVMFNMVYDDDIRFDVDDDNDGTPDRQISKLQWKEMFGLGLTYTL